MLSALATHIVSAEKSEAELHGIEVPLVACATPTGAVATSGAVVPGAAGESFMVTVRNDGNTLLTAGTIDLYREGSSQPFTSASIGFGANTRMASIYDPELAVLAVNRRGFRDVEAFALGDAALHVDQHHVAQFFARADVGERAADHAGPYEGDLLAGHWVVS